MFANIDSNDKNNTLNVNDRDQNNQSSHPLSLPIDHRSAVSAADSTTANIHSNPMTENRSVISNKRSAYCKFEYQAPIAKTWWILNNTGNW